MTRTVTTAIIFIASRITHGHFPKLQGFKFSQDHGLYCYDGRELTVEEFNGISERVLDMKDNLYSLSVRLFEREVEESTETASVQGQAKAPVLTVVPDPEPPPAADPEPDPVVVQTTPAATEDPPVEDIKVGDTVYYRGGSPPLTVTAIDEEGMADLEYTVEGREKPAHARYHVKALTHTDTKYVVPTGEGEETAKQEEAPAAEPEKVEEPSLDDFLNASPDSDPDKPAEELALTTDAPKTEETPKPAPTTTKPPRGGNRASK